MGNTQTIMLGLISFLSTNFFRTYIIYRFIHIFVSPKRDNKIHELSVYLCFFAFTFLVNYIWHTPILNILNNIVMYSLIITFYYGSILHKFLIILLIYCIDITCEIISVYSLHNYGIDHQYNDLSPFMSILLFFIFEFIIESVFNKHFKQESVYISIHCLFILLFFPLMSIFILILLLINELTNRPVFISISICLLTINLLIIYLYNYLISLFQRIQNHILLERQSESYYNQLCLLTNTNNKIQSFRHDLHNHINELYMMAKKNDTTNIINYLESMRCSISDDTEYINSGNPDVDSILNYLLSKAYNNSCNVNCRVIVPPHLKVDPFDLNVILSNLIDNAITAASNSVLRDLSVFIRWDRNILLINIKNSYTTPIKAINHRYITTKKDTQIHGIGLENVNRIVNKYNGIIHIEDKDNIFDVKTMLYV